MTTVSFTTISTKFGTLSLIWKELANKPIILRVILSNEQNTSEERISQHFKKLKQNSCELIDNIGKKIQIYLKGDSIDFDLSNIALDICSNFQKRVLITEHKIPRGRISTYKRIAKKLNSPKGARAVGRALSTNPFPIIIPCHRAIRSDGKLGGYQGGLEMKRKLLEMEGIVINRNNIVVSDSFYY